MKTINVTFEDDEIKILELRKGNRNWREFLLDLVKEQNVGKGGGA